MTRSPRTRAPSGELEQLIDALERAGLRGHGGAHFPTATKLRAVAAGRRAPVVVVNGAEGEPLSRKDRFLLMARGGEVLNGALVTASALGASRIVVAVDAGRPATLEAVSREISARPELRRRGAVRVEVTGVPAGFVTGQETALINVLSGGPAKPTTTPPYPFQRGLDRRPTLVSNVETFAQIARVTAGSYDGSRHISVSGAVARPAVVRVGPQTTVRQAIDAAGGTVDRPRAVLLGGYGGTWAAAPEALDLALDEPTLRGAGLTLGAGIVHVLGAERCGVAETARIARWMAGQSAGQCGPCVFGLEAIAEALESLCPTSAASTIARSDAAVAAGLAGPAALDRLSRWCAMVTGRGACAHPDGVARFVGSALAVFATEFADHAAHGRCERCADALARSPLGPDGAMATAQGRRMSSPTAVAA